MKRKKIKKVDPITIAVLIAGIASVTTKVGYGIKTESSRKRMLTLYSEYLGRVEGVNWYFLNSLVSVCTYAMNATALNADLLFSFRFSLEKIKIHFASEKTTQDSVEDILKRLDAQKTETLSKRDQEQTESKIKTYFSSSVYDDFSRMADQMATIIEEDSKKKESICLSENHTDKPSEEQVKAYEELNKVATELEETTNILNLFKVTDKSEEHRETWLKNMMKYAPEKEKSVKDLISSNQRYKRVFKGLLYTIELLIPFKISNIEYVIDAVKTVIFSFTEENFKKGLKSVIVGFSEIGIKYCGTLLIAKYIGEIAGGIVPSVETIQNIKGILDTKKTVTNLEKELKSKIAEQQIKNDNILVTQSLQVNSIANNSILCYKMLKLLTNANLRLNIPTPNIDDNKEIKALCKENFYLCSIELGKEYVSKHFSGTRICPKDVFIAESSNTEALEKNKFTLNTKINKEQGLFYWNWFFSTANTSIVYFKQVKEFNVSEEKRLFVQKFDDAEKVLPYNEVFLPKYDTKEKYSMGKAYFYNNLIKQKAVSEEKHYIHDKEIEIQRLKVSGNIMLFFRIRDELVQKATYFKGNLCKKIDEVLDLKPADPTKSAISVSNHTKPKRPTHGNNKLAVNKARNEIEIKFLQKLCSLLEKAVSPYSDEEKEEVRKTLLGYFRPKTEADFNSNSTKYKEYSRTLFIPIKLTNTSILINVLDAMFLLYNKVIDEKTVIFAVGKHKIPFFSFKMRDFKPGDDSAILNYYSKGNQDCVLPNLIASSDKSRNRNISPTEFLQLHKKGWFTQETPGIKDFRDLDNLPKLSKEEENALLDTVNREDIDDLTVLMSRIDTSKVPFKAAIKGETGIFNTKLLFNQDIMAISKKTVRCNRKSDDPIDIDVGNISFNKEYEHFMNCENSFQMVKVELKTENTAKAYKYNFLANKQDISFPRIMVEEAKEGEIGFKPYFYILVYYARKEQSEMEAKNSILLQISKKMSKLNFLGLSYMMENQEERKKTTLIPIIKKNMLLPDEKKEGIRIEVFVAPTESKKYKENSSICSSVNAK